MTTNTAPTLPALTDAEVVASARTPNPGPGTPGVAVVVLRFEGGFSVFVRPPQAMHRSTDPEVRARQEPTHVGPFATEAEARQRANAVWRRLQTGDAPADAAQA